MVAKVYSFTLFGLEAYPVEIEVDVSNGLPTVNLIGLADTAIKESKIRVKSALKNSGFHWPVRKITISLTPSHIKKEGSGFDLAIAMGILASSGQISTENLKNYCFLGELSLDGSLLSTKGILPISLAMLNSNMRHIVVPAQNIKEAGIISELHAYPLDSLKQTVEFLNYPDMIQPYKLTADTLNIAQTAYPLDFSEVKGQFFAKRAIEIAVAGGHNILFIGPPGSGKTMLAKRIPSIMPSLSLNEALEITKIHSVAGIVPPQTGIVSTRPFRCPHHNISDAALVGGGGIPSPGEISLAHHGVLFLDELPEFHRNSLEALRQPLEDGCISISRVTRSFVFPASFILACAMNPCPCGYYTDTRKTCRCNPNAIDRYMGKISGPLLDRIDIHIELPSIKYQELSDTKDAEPSIQIKTRVEKTRIIQRKRFATDGIYCNAQMHTKLIKKYCALENEAQKLLKMAMNELGLSARAYSKILKIARTIADLAESDGIHAEHIAEAIQYRSLDKQW